MKLITTEIGNFLKQQKLGYVATSSQENIPNISPKGTIIAWDEEHLCFADIRSPDTIQNLETNPHLEINVINPFTRKGFLFKGVATILRNGSLYEDILKNYRDSGVKSPIGSIVFVTVEKIETVSSPLYDIGMNEEQMKKKWTQFYLEK